MAEQIKSILNSTKKSLSLSADYDEFDPEIIMYINSVFSTLHQLGVGPLTGYSIVDDSEEWDSYFGGEENPLLNSVKTYMYMKVRLMFDIPMTSFAIDAFQKQITEYEWRFTVVHDSETVANATPTVVIPTPEPGLPNIWNLTGLSDFPPEAPIGAMGIDLSTGDIFTKSA